MTSGENLTARLSAAERDRSSAPIAVRDAASLLVLDRSERTILMGRRSMRHVFMPGRFVFPGGRVDPTDARVHVARPYDPVTLAKLTAGMRSGRGEARAKALGIAALRETYEETGVLIGERGADLPSGAAFAPFAERGIGLDLSSLRFFMRAITPPGRPRRFDTRFFVVDRACVAEVDESRVGEDAELEEIAWVEIDAARRMELATITLTVLDELVARLDADPSLPADVGVPYYRWQRQGFIRTIL